MYMAIGLANSRMTLLERYQAFILYQMNGKKESRNFTLYSPKGIRYARFTNREARATQADTGVQAACPRYFSFR